ncbi:hypothetical protein NEF87_001360 [Candidatus Lokiarchaeum ossiferum]|uniref:Peptidylprolyl isomerase n=1 Tax=Candidatus Lokiarchaeum ossiferum TaxID=2951803 RepID=A0ABY6HNH8_9ARCH|nr:hypothetical protein NEF87_001360 [Candidatus Lokiarchaeum sp. B-35]
MNIPSKNPKHNARKQQYVKKQNLSANSINPRLIFMGIGFVIIVVAVVILVINIDNLNPANGGEEETRVIEYGDSAILEFKMWVDTNGDGLVDWDEYHDDENNEITPAMGGEVYPTISTSAEPYGFYGAMVGMEQGQTKRFVLEANIDDNGDGIDDNTGLKTQSYGKPSSPYYNTAIRYYIKILNITKKGEDPLPWNVQQPANPIVPPSSSNIGITDMFYCANSVTIKKFD